MSDVVRSDGRTPHQLRPVTFEVDVQRSALSSVMTTFGHTKVLTAVSVAEKTPAWREGQGWITAEYAMLPGASDNRINRDRNGVSSRSTEIERLIGRSLRAGVDLARLPAVTLTIDCDVIDADGGTRTAAITGAWVALARALASLGASEAITAHIAAVSVGIVEGICVLDLPYAEDVKADVDMNVVMTAAGGFVEVQGTAEGTVFAREELGVLLDLATAGVGELAGKQQAAIAT